MALANQAQHHGFRVILGDAKGISGQRIKRFEEKPLSCEQLAQLVRRNFELSDFDGGAEVEAAAETRPVADLFLLVGHDGPRRVQIKTDDDLNAFFSTPFQHTALPSIEVQLALGMKLERRKVDDMMRQKRLDKMEQIAVENRELRSKWDRTVERLEELERARQRDLEDVKKLLSSTHGQLIRLQSEGRDSIEKRLFSLQELVTKDIKDDLAERQRSINALGRDLSDLRDFCEGKIEMCEQRLTNGVLDVDKQVKHQQDVLERMRQIQESSQQDLVQHTKQLLVLDSVKQDKGLFLDKTADMDLRTETIYQELSEKLGNLDKSFGDRLTETEAQLSSAREKVSQQIRQQLEEMGGNLGAQIEKLREEDENLRRSLGELDTHHTTQRDTAVDALKATEIAQLSTDNAALRAKLDSEAKSLREHHVVLHGELTQKLAALDKELTMNIEDRDEAVNKRVDEKIVEDATKIANIEQRLVNMVSDVRKELEQVSATAQDDVISATKDLGDTLKSVNEKQEITKQATDSALDRLNELSASTKNVQSTIQMQMQAVQIQAHEGTSANTRMLQDLREDQVRYRDKISKHISVLQIDTGNQAEAVATLEQQKKRLRLEFDAMSEDYKEYVTDMDTWTKDIKTKVTQLFKGLEPRVVEWRVGNISQKIEQLARPMALRSESFDLSGVKDMRFDWFLNGWGGSAEGVCMLRVFAPSGTSVRSEIAMGRISQQARDWESGAVGGELWTDYFFDKNWLKEVYNDKITITFEITHNHRDADDAIGKSVKLDTD